ncbi:uncharacterized protein PFL1_01446 [Pseudozyma flocculosa PF-1]|uniref:BHLH domain-containing protein n=1 Tax=Pseudozyma flocculosa TaxID=84751 RepID=A0A5C3EWK7_9BASI|nr:uncharacterized protein PFL1_01446 [Pseudozyma flocculosa PF-1]EPQ31261.1 hypothetical protein PFL1_01446 [Pseudozyma flocculosa PF-1]SPO36240.1 uncharacterized protein PSFLO_01711 [Pseudozyma flocculosa]
MAAPKKKLPASRPSSSSRSTPSSEASTSTNTNTSTRGRSPGPSAARLLDQESTQRPDAASSSLSNTTAIPSATAVASDSPGSASASTPQPRPAKRKRRSELSPSSKASHSTVEKERREAMNERFNELACLIPQLQEALVQGKKPTKGDIVRASINYHHQQEERVQHLSRQLELLANHSTAAHLASLPAAQPHHAMTMAAPALRPAPSASTGTAASTPRPMNANVRVSPPPPPPDSATSQMTSFPAPHVDLSNLERSSDAGSSAHSELTLSDAPSPFKDTAMAPQWSASSWAGWSGREDPSFVKLEVPRDLLSAFNLAELGQNPLLPPSSLSSPAQSSHRNSFQVDSGLSAGSGAESLIPQRSLSDSFDADTFALLSSHLRIQDASLIGEDGTGSAYTHRIGEAPLSAEAHRRKHTLELDGEETLQLLRDTAPAGEFAFVRDADFLAPSFDFERGGHSFFLGDPPGADGSLAAAPESVDDSARAFPTLLRTDKPVAAQQQR